MKALFKLSSFFRLNCKIWFLAAIQFFALSSYSQITFEKILTDSNAVNSLNGNWVNVLPEGGYAYLARNSNGVKIFRFDVNGNLLQQYAYALPSYIPYSIASFSNYNYWITGQDLNSNTYFILQLDSLGQITLNMTNLWGAVGHTKGVGVKNSAWHSILSLWWSDDEMGYNPTYVENYDNVGNRIWLNDITPNSLADGANSVAFSADSGLFSVASIIHNYYDSCCQYSSTWVRRFNKYGSILWQKDYADIYFTLDATSDGGCVVTNRNEFIKLDSLGDSLWTKQITAHFPFTALHDQIIIRQTYDNGYAICGTGLLPGKTDSDILIYRTDSNGDSLWTKAIGYCGDEFMGNFEITSDSGFVISGTTNSYGNPKAYFVKLDKDGNIGSSTIPITSGGNFNVLCNSDSLVLSAPCGFSYLWSTGESTEEITINQPGNYFVTMTDSTGNQFISDTFSLNVSTPPVVELGNDTAICSYQSVRLSPGTYSYYRWQDNSTDSFFVADMGGWYSVLVTDSNGCSGTDSIRITSNMAPVIELGNDTVVCTTTILSLDAGAGYSAYLWQDQSSNQFLLAVDTINSGQDTILYYVTVLDSNSCSSVDSMEVVYTICTEVEADEMGYFMISPNPFSGEVRVRRNSSKVEKMKVSIVSVNGEEILNDVLRGNEAIFDLSFLPEGVYLLRVSNDVFFSNFKLIKTPDQ